MAVRHVGLGHNSTGRSTARAMDAKFRERLGPPKDEPWIWLTREMLESAAFRSLSRRAQQCLFRICIENMAHAGRENGGLIVTYEDFVAYGVRRSSIASAIRELEEAGFLADTLRGGLAHGVAKIPSRYRLTWLVDRDGQKATNEWRRFSERISPDPETCLDPDPLSCPDTN